MRDAQVLLADIEEAAAKILGYAAGHSRQTVFTDAMRFDTGLPSKMSFRGAERRGIWVGESSHSPAPAQIPHFARDDSKTLRRTADWYDAILHNLHVIGETVKRLPAAVKDQRAEVPWREIAGMRDFIAHAYFALDLDLVWDSIQRDLPELLGAVQALRSR